MIYALFENVQCEGAAWEEVWASTTLMCFYFEITGTMFLEKHQPSKRIFVHTKVKLYNEFEKPEIRCFFLRIQQLTILRLSDILAVRIYLQLTFLQKNL